MGKRRLKPQFPCGSCRRETEDCASLGCEVCDHWFHIECEHVSEYDFKKWNEVDGSYLCTTCRNDGDTFDYLRGITRLERASKRGLSALKDAAAVETLLLNGDIFYRPPTTETISFEEGNIDRVSKSIFDRFTNEKGYPVSTTGDGDCLFNAASLCTTGSEIKSVELRYKTALMLINEEDSVKSHKDKASLLDLAPDYPSVIKDCAQLGRFSSQWTIIALSKVMMRPIRVIFPAVSGTKGLAFNTLNCVCNEEALSEPIRIMWTTVREPTSAMVSGKKLWIPNHFVPVISSIHSVPISSGNGLEATNVNRKENVLTDQHLHSSPDISLVNHSDSQTNYSAPRPTSPCLLSSPYENCFNSPNTPPSSSTPNSDNDWEIPKRRCRTTFRGLNNEKVNTYNKFDSLSDNTDSEHSLPHDADVDRKPVRKRKRKERNNGEYGRTKYISDEESDLDTSSETTNVNTSGHVEINGPSRGKLTNGKFLDTNSLLDLFSNDEDPLDCVPAGVKEDAYFIVNNRTNNDRERAGQRREFWDDCGAWGKSAFPAQHYLPSAGRLVFVIKRQGKFVVEKTGKQFEVLVPQPENKDLLIINRSYATLKASAQYKRRISWIGNAPEGYNNLAMDKIIYEFSGQFPGRGLHGHTKTTTKSQPYIRAKPTFKELAKTMIQTVSAKNVHDKLNNNDDIHETPRNLKQVQNMKYNQNKKIKVARKDMCLTNMADHLINTVNKVYQGHPFIRSVTHLESGPSAILYTDEQVKDIRRFVCREEGAILGIDKTYNLGQLFLTTTVFKNLSVVRIDTGESPIFLGPSFLHRKSDLETFNVFFGHIASKFTDTELENMIVGSDDEAALKKSIRRSFTGCTQLLCTRHLKQNVKDYLTRKVGTNEKDKRHIVESLFGENGLTNADDTIVFNTRLDAVNDVVSERARDFKSYLESRVVPLIRKHINLPSRIKNVDSDWTNNNAESMNNLLKIGTNHKVEDMTTLISIIQTLVVSMYKDVEKSIVGVGNYRLTKPFEHHRISIDSWCNKTVEERTSLLAKFYRDKGKTQSVTSTNGQLTIPCTPGGGKKPHQRRRQAAERATPSK